MVHSTWGDWFVADEIEASSPDGLALWYLGCNGFVLRTPGTTVYIDPYFGDGDPPNTIRNIPVPMNPVDATACDAVLVTHEHVDHVHPPSYGPLVEDLGADIYAPEAAYESPQYDGEVDPPEDRKRVIDVGEEFEIGDLTIYVRGANDPDAIEPVSYVVEHESGSFFHPGDSRPADAFDEVGREFDLDVGAFAFGTVGRIYKPADDIAEPTDWYNNGDQILDATNRLGLDRLMPTHWDMWAGVGADPKAIVEHARSYPYPRQVDLVSIGDRIDLDKPGIVPPQALRNE